MSSALAISLPLGLILGVSAHRAGLCTVKAVAEVMTSRRGWVLWAFLKASLWTTGILGLAVLAGAAPPLAHRPIELQTLLGGLVFGLGAGLNGACSFSTLTRLAEGHAVMAFTLAGWPLGMLAVRALLQGLHLPPAPAETMPFWVFFATTAWMLWEGGRVLHRLRSGGMSAIRDGYWPLSLGVALVAGANAGLLLAGQPWSFTSTALCATDSAPLAGCAHSAALWAISGAAMIGMVGSAALRGSFRLRRLRAKAVLRHGLAGVTMGAGAALMPGGNDGLILFGLPALSPHALPAWGMIVAGIALSLTVMRALGRMVPVIRCNGDVCRTSL